MKSPLTGGACDLIETISADALNRLYIDKLTFDISDHLPGIVELQRFLCIDTGYEFFTPLEAAGSPSFYRDLYSKAEHADWAYSDARWEFGIVADLASTGDDAVLDIGAGDGSFLSGLRDRVGEVRGLETSPYGREAAERRGLFLIDETIETHAAENPGRYDLVTAFQVLEHVTDPRSFIAACRETLKPGGRLALAVPDNDGFVGMAKDLPLNLPPHHMGRWRRRSLEALAGVFDMPLLQIEHEPLQTQTISWYKSVMEDAYLGKSRLTRSLYHRLGFSDFFERFVRGQAPTIHGHTILAIYRKP